METSEAFHNGENRQRLPLAWIAGAVIALLVLALLGYAILAGATEPLQADSPVPDFQLTALDGRPMNLSEQIGSVLVINFFASWCAPCRQEAADLERVWRDYQDRNVQFFGIAYKDASSKAQTFLDEFGVTYPSAVDPGNEIARAYGVTGVPETFVIDQQGHLLRHFLGPITMEQLAREIDAALEP